MDSVAASMRFGRREGIPEIGFGAIFDVTLPLGSEDIIGEDPTMAFEIGGRYGQTYGQVNVLAGASFLINMEDGSDMKYKEGNVINLFANYWVGEHDSGLLPEDLKYLYHKIALSHEMIIDGLFE